MGSILYRGTNLTTGELGRAPSLPLSTTNRIAILWVDNGYAQRISDPDDRRIVRVALTDSDRLLYVTIENHMAEGA